jgi:hypothetical protein
MGQQCHRGSPCIHVSDGNYRIFGSVILCGCQFELTPNRRDPMCGLFDAYIGACRDRKVAEQNSKDTTSEIQQSEIQQE